ncbi:RusA family crossover junction endodeoxyribonuclease [Butyricicoccus sp.]|uniref:RusA family crossover junction endodeoxyribonuclease n=1 Tax=Butyricicoccus sp. TaxID=2049021 RepID=UPI003F184F23
MMVLFSVPGEPQGKGRPRFSRHNGRTITHTPDKTVLYENLVVTEYQAQMGAFRFPDDAQLRMSVWAYYGIPKSTSKRKREAMKAGTIRPTKKPDVDNILKCVADALNGVAYRDDAQIVEVVMEKFYDENPRVDIGIEVVQNG